MFSVTTVSTFVDNVFEYLQLSWLELFLCGLSAIAYVIFTSKRLQAKKARKVTTSKKIANRSSGSEAGSHSPRSSSADHETAQETSSKDNRPIKKVMMRANDIRSCGRNGNLNGAIKVYEKLGSDGEHTLVLNSLLDACVENGNMEKAAHYFARAQSLQLADTVSCNKMIKGFVAQGREQEGRCILQELVSNKQANATSYHALLNARINSEDSRGAWRLVAEMQRNGIAPNAVTCAILLKGKLQSAEEVSRVLLLVDAMEEQMDEVLFMAVAEACVRVGRLDVLSRQMEKFKKRTTSGGALSPETYRLYGSMIKAYGKARDLKKVWDLWNQMVADGGQLTSVTLGCMVEALVANGQSNEAWEIVQKLLKDDSTKSLVNTVICSSILKGFTYTYDTDKVMALYKQMQAHHIQPNTITFNTMLNAFAQCGCMQFAPEVLQDMRAAAPSVQPDIVTYSTLVKGYCHAGSLDRALQVFRDMQQEKKCAPDEVLFNSLLGGCAKEFRLEEALQLLDEMKVCGVAPSNYTLSMLVKLMCRCRQLDQAFTVLEDISKEYKFKINIQVYTCLIQGCFHNGQTDKASVVYQTILSEGLLPDAMTYTVLIKGFLYAGNTDKAIELMRRAHGIEETVSCDIKSKTSSFGSLENQEANLLKAYNGPRGKSAAPGTNPGCLDEIVAALGGAASKEAAQLMNDINSAAPIAPSRPRPMRQRQWGR